MRISTKGASKPLLWKETRRSASSDADPPREHREDEDTVRIELEREGSRQRVMAHRDEEDHENHQPDQALPFAGSPDGRLRPRRTSVSSAAGTIGSRPATTANDRKARQARISPSGTLEVTATAPGVALIGSGGSTAGDFGHPDFFGRDLLKARAQILQHEDDPEDSEEDGQEDHDRQRYGSSL